MNPKYLNIFQNTMMTLSNFWILYKIKLLIGVILAKSYAIWDDESTPNLNWSTLLYEI